MSKNISFEAVNRPEKNSYSSSDEMFTIEKVLWKGDWCMSISRALPVEPKDREPFYVYSHWTLLKAVIGRYATMEAARQACKQTGTEIEKFLRDKWFLKKTAT